MLDQIQGQDKARRTLEAVVAGRLNRPLLLHGPEGVGKRFSALLTTRSLLCQGDRTVACGCLSCTQIRQDVHPDVLVIRATDKDIGVDEIRDALQSLLVYPTQGEHRVVILDGADRLTPAAGNALLKTLEEPPPYARFFLLAEERSQVLPTIRSRVGEVCFLPLPAAFVQSVLSRHLPDPAKALVIARLSEGSVGRALHVWGSGRLGLRDKILDLFKAAVRRDLRVVFALVDGLEKDLDLGLGFADLLLHDLLMHPTYPDRCLNTDRMEALADLAGQGPRGGWEKVRVRLGELKKLKGERKIQAAFHLKALFADLFVGI